MDIFQKSKGDIITVDEVFERLREQHNKVLALRASRVVRISSHGMVFLNILLNRLDKMADESGRAGENFRSLYIDI